MTAGEMSDRLEDIIEALIPLACGAYQTPLILAAINELYRTLRTIEPDFDMSGRRMAVPTAEAARDLAARHASFSMALYEFADLSEATA